MTAFFMGEMSVICTHIKKNQMGCAFAGMTPFLVLWDNFLLVVWKQGFKKHRHASEGWHPIYLFFAAFYLLLI